MRAAQRRHRQRGRRRERLHPHRPLGLVIAVGERQCGERRAAACASNDAASRTPRAGQPFDALPSRRATALRRSGSGCGSSPAIARPDARRAADTCRPAALRASSASAFAGGGVHPLGRIDDTDLGAAAMARQVRPARSAPRMRSTTIHSTGFAHVVGRRRSARRRAGRDAGRRRHNGSPDIHRRACRRRAASRTAARERAHRPAHPLADAARTADQQRVRPALATRDEIGERCALPVERRDRRTRTAVRRASRRRRRSPVIARRRCAPDPPEPRRAAASSRSRESAADPRCARARYALRTRSKNSAASRSNLSSAWPRADIAVEPLARHSAGTSNSSVRSGLQSRMHGPLELARSVRATRRGRHPDRRRWRR